MMNDHLFNVQTLEQFQKETQNVGDLDKIVHSSTKHTLLLHYIQNDNVDIVQYLLDNGVDGNFAVNGKIPIIEAYIANIDLFVILMTYGVDTNVLDTDGNSVIDIMLLESDNIIGQDEYIHHYMEIFIQNGTYLVKKDNLRKYEKYIAKSFMKYLCSENSYTF